MGHHLVVKVYRLRLNMAIEIVDLASYQMVIFHSYVNVYQRVDPPNQSKR